MEARKKELRATATSKDLTCRQKMIQLANGAECMIDPMESLGYSEEEMAYMNDYIIYDMDEGNLPYRPRYILPNYYRFVEKGCTYLSIDPPDNLENLLDGLFILYHHIPSINSYPVYLGPLDRLIDPFLTENEASDYQKIKRFLNQLNKTIVNTYCHTDIGTNPTKAGMHLFKALIDLGRANFQIVYRYDSEENSDELTQLAVTTGLMYDNVSFSHILTDKNESNNYGIMGCYNVLPYGGGSYTTLRLCIDHLVKEVMSTEEFIEDLLPMVVRMIMNMMDKRIKFIVEESNFYENLFLEEEGFINKKEFTAVMEVDGFRDCINYLLKKERIKETYGSSERGDNIAMSIIDTIKSIISMHDAPYIERTRGRYLLHVQLEDNNKDSERNPKGMRILRNPILPIQGNQSFLFENCWKNGIARLSVSNPIEHNDMDMILNRMNELYREGYQSIVVVDETNE